MIKKILLRFRQWSAIAGIRIHNELILKTEPTGSFNCWSLNIRRERTDMWGSFITEGAD